jgi:hypothetical protein
MVNPLEGPATRPHPPATDDGPASSNPGLAAGASTWTRFPRKPAIIVLLASAFIAVSVLSIHALTGGSSNLSLDDLLVRAGQSDAPADWLAYARKALAAGSFDNAADACNKALEKEPLNRDARFLRASALVRAGRKEEFFDFAHTVLQTDAKLVQDMLNMPQARAFSGEEEFKRLVDAVDTQVKD